MTLGLAGTAGIRRAALDAYLRLRRRSGGCLMICGWEGDREDVDRRHALSARLLRAGGAIPLGTSAGEAWNRGRFAGRTCATS